MTAAETSRRTAADAASGAGTGSDGLSCPSRRALLRAAALAGVGMPLLAACGSGSPAANSGGGGSSASGGAGSPSRSPGGGVPSSGGGGGPNGSNEPSSGGGASVLATTHQVPVGGGLILPQQAIVITQPKAGKFEGFSAICTHAGCPLISVTGGTINCPCHGSQFSIKNGHVVTGPAIVPLPKKPVKVHGKDISLA